MPRLPYGLSWMCKGGRVHSSTKSSQEVLIKEQCTANLYPLILGNAWYQRLAECGQACLSGSPKIGPLNGKLPHTRSRLHPRAGHLQHTKADGTPHDRNYECLPRYDTSIITETICRWLTLFFFSPRKFQLAASRVCSRSIFGPFLRLLHNFAFSATERPNLEERGPLLATQRHVGATHNSRES